MWNGLEISEDLRRGEHALAVSSLIGMPLSRLLRVRETVVIDTPGPVRNVPQGSALLADQCAPPDKTLDAL